MKNYILVICFVFHSLALFSQSEIEKDVRVLFESELKKNNVFNGVLKIYSHSKSIDIQCSGGMLKNGDSVSNKNPFYTASIGKTFTASAIGLLKDKGQLSLSDKISKYLSQDILAELHVLNGVNSSSKITIAQLLQHTSGLPDYFEDETIDGSPNIISQLFISPDIIWSPYDCIQFTKEKMKPLFLPGEGYHYTDTEYVLLGLIIENVSGLELHEFFETYIFKPLKMHHTYMNLRSKPIQETTKMADVYVSNLDISSFKSLSADWAGGGIVSTSQDLITFQDALFNGKLVDEETLQKMQNWISETKGMYYGFGLRKIVFNEIDSSLPEIQVIGHSGSTGSFLFYCPNLDTYIAGSLNQTEEVRSSVVLIANVLKVIQNSK